MPEISFGIGIAGDHYLLARFDKRVEQVEKLLLGTALAVEELNVVDQQQIQCPVIALEVVERLVLIGADDIRYIGFGVDITYFRRGVLQQDVVSDGLDQVRFAQADAAINEQRVV